MGNLYAQLVILSIRAFKAIPEPLQPYAVYAGYNWYVQLSGRRTIAEGSDCITDLVRNGTAEYGYISPETVPIQEETILHPGNIYAATKACQNMLSKIYSDAYQMDIIMVRAFNHIGPAQSPIFVVSDFCKQVAEIEKGKREAVIRVGNLSAYRDFTDVKDVVAAYALLIEKGKKGETYNVGSGKAIQIQSILKELLQLSSVEIKIEVDEAKLRPIDVPIIEADIKKLVETTGWKRKYELTDTLKETLNYWRQTV